MWTDRRLRAFIASYYPWFLPIYLRYDQHIKRVDAARYFLLYHYGGVYADLDFVRVNRFQPPCTTYM